ncbi:MAG: extracellular solute-binding protein [Clostridia bacterium]
MKRYIKIAFIITLILCLLTSCGILNNNYEKEELLTLTVAVRSGESSLLQKVQEEFERENKGITLKIIELSSGFEQYSLLSSAFSSGEYLFDIVETEDVWIEDFIDKKWIIPLSDTLKADEEYFDYVQDSFIRNDTAYVAPLHMDLGMLYSLDNYDWDGEYSSISKYDRNTEEELKIDNSREDIVCALMELIEYMDGDVDGALRLYNSIYHTKGDERMNIDAFKKGDVPIMHSWSSVIPELYEDSSEVSAIFKAHNTPLSQNGRETSVAKLFGLSISSLSEHKKECEKVLEFFSRDNVQKELIKESGMYPLKPKLYSDYTIISAWSHIPKMESRMQNVQLRPHIKNYAQIAMQIKNDVLKYVERKTLDSPTEEIISFLRDN